MQTDAVWRPIWITSNKPQAQFGDIDSALPELRSSSTPYGVVSERYTYPGLRFACTGLSTSNAYGVKRHEASLHFYLTILARTLYKRSNFRIPDINQEIYLMQFGTLEFFLFTAKSQMHKVLGDLGNASRNFQFSIFN
ncbi:MAG: hypothetical protein LBK58_16165 [Prevotellaceae bacterium]|nr:hypothetical protein [Prevotellaceae bacterium]